MLDRAPNKGTDPYDLKGVKAPNNARVRVAGTVIGTEVEAGSVTVVEPAVSALPSSGTTRVLVMLAHWTAPDNVTPESARSQIFGDSNWWYRDASYQAMGQAGDVTPWMRIAGPADNRCYGDTYSVMEQAKSAAASLGFAVGSYDNYVVYFPYAGAAPGSDCAGSDLRE